MLPRQCSVGLLHFSLARSSKCICQSLKEDFSWGFKDSFVIPHACPLDIWLESSKDPILFSWSFILRVWGGFCFEASQRGTWNQASDWSHWKIPVWLRVSTAKDINAQRYHLQLALSSNPLLFMELIEACFWQLVCWRCLPPHQRL